MNNKKPQSHTNKLIVAKLEEHGVVKGSEYRMSNCMGGVAVNGFLIKSIEAAVTYCTLPAGQYFYQ